MSARAPQPVDDLAQVLNVFLADADVHPYGIADVVQLGDRSQWWMDGRAVVGLMDLPGSSLPVLYAVSTAPADTLSLLRRLVPVLPAKFMATGPSGLSATLSDHYRAAFAAPYLKMHLRERILLPPRDPRVVVLTRHDLPALERLFDTDPVAGDFFHPGLLDTGLYLGIWSERDVAAAGGIHVIDEVHRVAAIGNVSTHPDHRRRGLARGVVATLCHRLLERVDLVGLNCRQNNAAALALYRTLGFATVLDYEEAQLVRH